MQKKFLKIAPYLVLLIVFTIASSLLAWDIKISKSNTYIATFLMKEKSRSVIETFESNFLASKITNKNDFIELLTNYAEQENIRFMALTDENGTILTSNNKTMIGETLPINDKKNPHTANGKYINLDIPFTSEELHNSDFFIVQKKIFLNHSRLRHKNSTHKEFSSSEGIHNNMHSGIEKRNMRMCNQLEQLDILKNLNKNIETLYLVIGFDIREILEAQLLDDKKSLINFIAFTILILLSILSFILIKKYQKYYRLIEESKIFFDGLMTTIPLGILTINNHNSIVTANPVAQNMLGSDNLIGKNICDYLPSIAFMDFTQPVINTMIKTANNQENSLELNSFSINLDENRKGIGIILRDLKEIQKLQEELNRKDRLASLGQLAAGIAHEIRNPLSSIKGFARIFEENTQEGSEEKTLAQIMSQEIQRVDKVISDLLEISKPNSLSLQIVSLKKVIDQAQKALIPQAKEHHIQFINDIQIEELLLDHDRILQVLHNIFINAIEAMKNGGTITVTAQKDVHNAIIKIKDTGHGIPQTKLAQLFTPYYTTKAKGTGLGLVIVQKIIEAHKGSIKVESTEENGTTFYISFPIK